MCTLHIKTRIAQGTTVSTIEEQAADVEKAEAATPAGAAADEGNVEAAAPAGAATGVENSAGSSSGF